MRQENITCLEEPFRSHWAGQDPFAAVEDLQGEVLRALEGRRTLRTEIAGHYADQYRLDVGQYPSSEQGLLALRNAPQQAARWQGPYLKRDVPDDPWGRAYVYKRPGQHGEYDLVSLGADGQPGGEGEAADVVSW